MTVLRLITPNSSCIIPPRYSNSATTSYPVSSPRRDHIYESYNVEVVEDKGEENQYEKEEEDPPA
jgi:hypothetical protein